MEFWEFLLQKEGDRSWLPLESPDVEILEGRYRVVARSSQVNTPVEIRVTHFAIAEDPPKRRTQKRSGQTNRDGLVVVIPFTLLQPGVWELRCTGDLMADMMGQGWQRSVKLQVLSHAFEEAGEWEPDWDDRRVEEDLPSIVQAEISQETTVASIPPIEVEETEPISVEAPASQNDLPLEETPVPLTSEIQAETPSLSLAADVVPPSEANEPISPTPELLPTPEPTRLSQDIEETAVEPEPIAAIAPPEITLPAEPIVTDPAEIFETATQLSDQMIESLFQGLDQALDPLVTSSADPISSVTSSNVPQLELLLTQETYSISRGQAFTLQGKIDRSLSSQAASFNPFPATLLVRLRDPQGGQTLTEERRSLVVETLPTQFSCTVNLAVEGQTRLMLGEIALVDASGSTVLTLQPFSVTADLDELLEAIANGFSESDLPPPLEFVEPISEADLNLAFLELLNAPKPVLHFQPSTNQPLPPQLHPADIDKPKVKALDLPFSNSVKTASTPIETPELPTEVSVTEGSNSVVVEPPIEAVVESDRVEPIEAVENTPPQEEPSTSDFFAEEADQPITWQPFEETIPEPAKPLSLEDIAFQALNLEARFWARLTALAYDTELANMLRMADVANPEAMANADLEAESDLAAQEVVVEDEVDLQPRDRTPIEPPPSLVLPKDEPIPLPQLDLPSGELISGKTINLTVTLPNVTSRIYVKLWILDRQTRSILDGPRWLMEFIPNSKSELEARTQLTVPFGCLEAQFEAIAVEMATHRESHKVTIDRLVMPPDLPSLSLDELDL